MPSYIKFKKIDVIPRLPLSGNLDITYRCNNNCLHCWLRVPPKSPERLSELTTDEIKTIVDGARKLGCKSWAISGGEPMLRPDFPEIFDYITRKCSSYSINTNGTLITPEIAELMKRKGRKMIALYGATADVHDHITKNPGSFQAAMRGFQLLQEAGSEFIVQIVPMKDNYHQFKEMKALAKSLSPLYRIGASWLFLSAQGDQRRNEEIKFQRLDPKDVIELDKPQISDEECEQEDCSCFLEDDRLFSSCINQRREFHIDPYGYMSFCSFIKDPALRYDLRSGSFQDCWEKFIPSLKDLVKGNQEYKENCGSCSLRNQCNWCPAYGYLEHRRYSAPVEYLCQVARESRKFKDDWEKDHCRYFKCADITIKMEYDMPITEKTFHPTFYPFQIDKPEESITTIQHHFEMPDLDVEKLGTKVYMWRNLEVRRKKNSWVYLRYLEKGGEVQTIVAFNEDYTKAKMYWNNAVINKNINTLDENSTYSDDISFTQTSLAHILANRGGFFLHSSGIIIGGKAVLFIGRSGAGKSTIRKIALLREEIKPLCDDRNIVRGGPDGYKVYGTWALKEPSCVEATTVPLGAVMFLEQARENTILPLQDKLEIVKKFIPCVIRPPMESNEWWENTLVNLEEISREIPCYRLRFDLTGRIVDHIENFVAGADCE